ncbi:uncharacterized protein LOC130743918 [Lotus japonicus]|uniref:uncharacterized protein LOC130743918 n=1 Tax=Lotus japonicus TaxID=34305 RepID=UPI00258CE5B2|nr:uncharacterized protein LOC130743918 [Lotus japonicus]
MVDVKAILNALLFCKNYGLKNVMVESDSTLAVGWVITKSNRPWKLLNDINQIDHLISEVNCTRAFHIFREANTIADSLAKEGCNRVAPLVEVLHSAAVLNS